MHSRKLVQIWSLMLPPLIKLFLWRACMGCLLVLEVLRSRGICLNSMCYVCDQEPEMVCHALISCSKVSTYFVNTNLDVSAFGAGSLVDFFLTRVSHLSKRRLVLFGIYYGQSESKEMSNCGLAIVFHPWSPSSRVSFFFKIGVELGRVTLLAIILGC